MAAQRYAKIAENYWTTYRPQATAQLPDPARFFRQIGREVEQRVRDLEPLMQDPTVDPDDFLARAGSLSMARKRAEEKALAEIVYEQEKEPGTEELDLPSVRVPGVASVE